MKISKVYFAFLSSRVYNLYMCLMEDDDQESRIEFMLSRNGRERQWFVRVMLTVLSRGSTSKLKVAVST